MSKHLMQWLVRSLVLLVLATGSAMAQTGYDPIDEKESNGTLPMVWKFSDREYQLRFSTEPVRTRALNGCPEWAMYRIYGGGELQLADLSFEVRSICYLYPVQSFWRYRIQVAQPALRQPQWIDCFGDFCWE